MDTTRPTPTLALELHRTFRHSPADLWIAWTEPTALSRWFSPTGEYRTVVTALDLRPGGAWRVEMHHSGGNVHPVGGRYVVVEPCTRLSFTWRWEDDPASRETLVTLRLLRVPGGTELTLTHERIADAEERGKHEQGWCGCLDRLRTEL